MENNDIKFSVLMSVYFKESPSYLEAALSSVFTQTVMPDEVVLVEDGPLTSELDETISKFEKEYPTILKVIKFENNRGLGKALHDGLLECSNEIVFRMDTDDIEDKDRFEKQLKIFKEKNVDVVGSNIAEFDETMTTITSHRIVPEHYEAIKKMAKSRNPINHVTVAMKKSKVIEAGNYISMYYFEDYYLWIRMMKIGAIFYNVQESLTDVRGGNDMIKRRGGKKYIKPIINFEKAILKLGYISKFEFLKNVLQRVIVSLIPNHFRFFVYKILLRK